MITIDGSFGEGGGQILRTALSLSALTGQDLTIENIRAGREKPGLRPQHATSALAVAEICGAEVRGAEVGSRTLTFKPHKVNGRSYFFDVSKISSSAGSTNMILQSIIWPLAFAEKKSRVVIKGGTHNPLAPTSDYISEVFLPSVAQMGLHCQYTMSRAGYYPIGGGEIKVEIAPVKSLQPIAFIKRDKPEHINLVSMVSNLPLSIADRQMNVGIECIKSMHLTSTNEMREYPSPGKGTLFFILLTAGNIRAGFQSLGEIKKRAEKVAQDACDEFRAYYKSEMALDKHLADQLIIPMALAESSSTFTTCQITQHLLTNIAIVERFLDVHFHISHGLGEPGTVTKVA